MKKSELFMLLASAERDAASLARAHPDISSAQRTDPRFVAAVSDARSAIFRELVNLALQEELFAAKMEAARDYIPMRPYSREDFLQNFPAPLDPEPEKPRRPWPTCRNCGKDLILANVERGFCNADCEAKARLSK